MIYFQSDSFQIELTAYGVSTTEENNLFSDNIYKSYSLPFVIPANSDLLQKIGLPNLDNIININTAIKGRVVFPERHYSATLFLGEIFDGKIECTINYGSSNIDTYGTKLKDLPWPIILSQNFTDHADEISYKSWPETGHNFPMIFHPEIAKKDDYEHFIGFANLYEMPGGYRENHVSEVPNDEGVLEDVYYNLNVMVPHPYLLEILRFGYAQEGKEITGQLVNHEVFRKAVYMPENFLERYDNNEYEKVSFSNRTDIINSSPLRNRYETSFVPESEGTYSLKLKFNIPPGLANNFRLTITRKDVNTGLPVEEIKRYESFSSRIQIDEELKINVETNNVFQPISVELTIKYTDVSLYEYNNMEWSFEGGRLNVFPTSYSLSEFMPDMTFGEYVNLLKNWLNLDITVKESYVKIDFAEKTVLDKPVKDHRHLEIPGYKKINNNNRFYKFSYANGEKVFYNKTGQVYSDLDVSDNDVINIDSEIQPASVEQRKELTNDYTYHRTAVFPEETSDLDFCFYSPRADQYKWPICPSGLANKFSQQKVVNNFWIKWLDFRINSYTFKEKFDCSIHESIYIDQHSYKYNERHIVKKLKKKIKSEHVVEVDVETETF